MSEKSLLNDYKGVDLGFIENITRVYLPKLKEKILKIKIDFGNRV
ncbi:MAG: hypothetical protein PHD79_06815 [Aliarcobacter sp.]|nr:hypothetical protein [Aliarcobacter sp.]